MIRKFVKRAVLGALVVTLTALSVLVLLKMRWDAQYFDGYDPSASLNASVISEEDREGYRRVAFAFDGLPGEPVPSLLAFPPETNGPAPCIIFLHGIGQDKDFLDVIASRFTAGGFAIASYDQYTRGERNIEDDNVFNGIAGLRRRAAMNVIDTRRMIDYFAERDDIDMDRIYLVGASYGAITGVNVAAMEPRIQAVVLTYGGGDLKRLLSSDSVKDELGALAGPLASLAAYIFAPADPMNRIAAIAPRPLLVQNGEGDRVVPFESGKALFDAAGEPKEFMKYPGDHIGLDEAMVWRVLDDTIGWLQRVETGVFSTLEAD